MAHEFAEKEIRPVAWEYDRDGTWPQEILEKAWALGLMNSHIPEEYGGPGVSYLDGALIEEELGWGCSGIATSTTANGLATAPLAIGGSDDLKRKYLTMLTEAPLLASFCLTEPNAGSDVSGMRTTAVRRGDRWVINGSKCFITNGGYADWYAVYAKTDKDAGHRGISCFLVPRDETVTVDKKEDKMGQRASNTATITFNETAVPLGHLELRRAARPGQAQHDRVLARQALRRRHRDGGHHRRRAGVRRLRLHQGLPGREADARREDHAALRGHVADPAPGHRARGAAAAPRRGAGRRAGVALRGHG